MDIQVDELCFQVEVSATSEEIQLRFASDSLSTGQMCKINKHQQAPLCLNYL